MSELFYRMQLIYFDIFSITVESNIGQRGIGISFRAEFIGRGNFIQNKPGSRRMAAANFGGFTLCVAFTSEVFRL